MSKPKLLWLQSITCNGNTHSFLNHPELFSILAHFELVHHPVLESDYSFEELIEGSVACDVLILEGSFLQEGFLKAGVEVSAIIEHYVKNLVLDEPLCMLPLNKMALNFEGVGVVEAARVHSFTKPKLKMEKLLTMRLLPLLNGT